MNKKPVRLLIGMLCLCLAFSGVSALGEETASLQATVEPDESAVATDAQTDQVLEDPGALSGNADAVGDADTSTALYVATATAPLKVRRSPDKSALGNGSIKKGETVYILELGNEWSKVDTGRNIGYVQTKYLSDIRDYSTSQGLTDEQIAGLTQSADAAAPAATDNSASGTFKENFKAYAIRTVTARREMDDRSSAAFQINKYEEVIVSTNQGDWSYVRYNNSYGYVPSDALFKWDRIDPYAGDIPGCIKHMGLAFVNCSANIKSYKDNGKETLKTVNPGSALAVEALDDQGRYPLAYWRTTGYIDKDDVSYLMKVVPWDEAQSGDMISCMSTYYAVGIHTLQYQGRNYNIYTGSSFISGLVVQPEETVNIYDIMGPYRQSTGYHKAPIMAPGALWGYGGGTCQVNTTLYNAIIQVPIYVNWRKVHANVGIYYCPVGFDAAVGGGDITMIFTNTLPYAIRFNFFMSDGCLTVAIFRV